MKSIFTELNANQKEVLNLIRVHKELSGAEISRITNLQPSTIVYILKALSDIKLIEFSKTGESTTKGGKKPTLYKINADVGYIFGLEILLHKIKLTVIDFAGNAVVMQEEEYPKGLKDENLINETVKLIDQFMKRPGFDKNAIIGIGIAIPGLVNSKKGLIYFSRKLELENYNFKEEIEKRIGISTFIGNDANAGVLGFRWFPDKDDDKFSNVIYLIYNEESSNIGAGILINNQLYEGSSGAAGEIFSNISTMSELIAESNKALEISKLITKSDYLHTSLSLLEIVGKLKHNHQIAISVVESLCQKMASQIISIVTFMNPQAVLIGGELAEHSDVTIRRIVALVNDKIQAYAKYGLDLPAIKTSRFGNFSVAMGAGAMVLNELFIAEKNGLN